MSGKDETAQPRPGHEEQANPTEEAGFEQQMEEALPEETTPSVRRRGAHLFLDEESEAEIERMIAQMGGFDVLEKEVASAGAELAEERELSGKVKGRVIKVTDEDVFVDLGGRDQGYVPRVQFDQPPAVGQEVELVVERFDPEEGLYLLRVPGAAELFDWETVQPGTVLDVRITGHNQGGLEGVVSGVRVFIPASHVALERVEDLSQFVGQTLRCEVLEVRRSQQGLVASRRQYLQREREAAKQRLLEELREGQVRRGRVRAVREFGAFVDLGGVDGLIPVSELSWMRVDRVEDVLRPGDEVEVQVLKVDREQERITLSLKRLQENPWDLVAAKYPLGATVTGRVTRLADFGAFVEIEPGVEGLVHISELATHRVKRPADVVQVGEEIQVRILDIQPQQRRMSLSRRAVLEDLQRQEEEKAVEEYRSGQIATGEQQRQEKEKKLKGGLEL